MNRTFCAQKRLTGFFALFLMLFLTACGSTRQTPPTKHELPAKAGGGYYKVGKPYTIKGKTYYPQENFSYDETGIASWYGADFHNKQTANGEIFNKNELTAAHKTLPMPSLARVTNLENGRSIVVRINDRGPFSGKRIIDLSKRSAQLLGFEKQGLAKVRVQVMAEESKAIADAMRSYGTRPRQETLLAQSPVQQAAPPPPATIPPPVRQETLATFKPPAVYEQRPVTGPNNIYVQLGAFRDIDNARRLQAEAAKIGQSVLAQADVRGVTFYRVRIGPLVNVATADNIIDSATRTGLSRDARIVVD